jgi:hypothetical protein
VCVGGGRDKCICLHARAQREREREKEREGEIDREREEQREIERREGCGRLLRDEQVNAGFKDVDKRAPERVLNYILASLMLRNRHAIQQHIHFHGF